MSAPWAVYPERVDGGQDVMLPFAILRNDTRPRFVVSRTFQVDGEEVSLAGDFRVFARSEDEGRIAAQLHFWSMAKSLVEE